VGLLHKRSSSIENSVIASSLWDAYPEIGA
jgi:hypothetical protein